MRPRPLSVKEALYKLRTMSERPLFSRETYISARGTVHTVATKQRGTYRAVDVPLSDWSAFFLRLHAKVQYLEKTPEGINVYAIADSTLGLDAHLADEKDN